ncbi:MAG: Vms1/Ankzf1 family peptidyl-tRNA hydrolase [Actinomycetota bacterium]|nr:Vms1/Ankzf1 family peptidyl-tRNA hydrolase [Actinomycetota bacterium]
MRTAELRQLLTQAGPWTWLYTDGPTGAPEGAVESLKHSLTDRLTTAGVPPEDAEAAVAAVSADSSVPSPSTRWVLVRDGKVVLDETFATDRVAEEQYGHGDFPAVVPLLRHLAAESRILTVETGRDGARLTDAVIGQHEPETAQTVDGEDQQITKVQAGGWSQARYQRHAEEVWQHNQSEVAEAVDRIVRERRPEHLFLSGDVRARQLLRERISAEAAALVVEVDADTRAAGADDTALHEAITETLASARQTRIETARDRAAAGDGRAGASGVSAVVAALQQAQVDTLVLDPQTAGSDSVLLALRNDPWIAISKADAYGVDGTSLAAIEAMARAAVLTDARVLFVEDELDDGEPRPERRTTPPVAALRWQSGPDADETGAGAPDGSTGHRDAATGHPSQAEGEDPGERNSREDPRVAGHPSPAEG